MTQEVVDENELDATVEKVEDIMQIMEYGIMRTPGLVIDGKVVLSGEVPKKETLKDLLTNN